MLVEAEPVPVTAGRPYSRQTMAAWLIMPPMSVTVALILPKIGPHDGAVTGATKISPCWIWERSSASMITRARPSTRPGEAAMPLSTPSSASSSLPSQDWTCSVVMPHSMRVNGSVMVCGGVFSAGAGRAVFSAVTIFLRRSISSGQITVPIGPPGAPTPQPVARSKSTSRTSVRLR